MSRFIFTSESVSMGHPDKVSDQVSDGRRNPVFSARIQSALSSSVMARTTMSWEGLMSPR